MIQAETELRRVLVAVDFCTRVAC